MVFFESVLKTGTPHPSKFSEALIDKGTSLIDRSAGKRLGRNLAYGLLKIFERDIEYTKEDNLYGLWEILRTADMSHENIGKYFERFDADAF